MSVKDHVSALEARHAELEVKLDMEQGHANPDKCLITDIKKQKLKIKDELAMLESA
ncbi:MAG: YdcH family protein [Alphaproteobacteria bacterium]